MRVFLPLPVSARGRISVALITTMMVAHLVMCAPRPAAACVEGAIADGTDLTIAFEGPVEITSTLEANRAVPLAMASDDFDEDGVADLIVGYASAESGVARLFRGDIASIYPNSPEAQRRRATRDLTGSPFLSPARSFALPAPADFLGTGDFDNDGYRDVVAAARGDSKVILLAGDGRGGFAVPCAVALPGRVTALVSGEINRADGLADLVVGLDGAEGPRVLVFEGPDGALKARPEVIALPVAASALGLGHLVGPTLADLAIAAGKELLVVQGRDRHLVAGDWSDPGVPLPTVDGHSFQDPIAARAALACGGFVGDHRVGVAAGGEPALGMRLNADAIDDLVVMRRGTSMPDVTLSSPRAIFTVTTAADEGLGSLRQTIRDANESPGLDEIRFAIASGPQSIRVESNLPEITDPVTIDATTQPGFAGMPLIEVNGGLAPGRSGLVVSAGNCVIRGLVVNRFQENAQELGGRGIELRVNGGNRIEGNIVGTDASGTDEIRNYLGISIAGGSAGNIVGGTVPAARNVICGEYRGVIVQDGATDNRIQGNYVGVDPTASFTLPGNIGVEILDVPRNVVGGTDAGAANVVGGASDYGVDIYSDDAAENLVQGNFIGTDPTGTRRLGNAAGVGICGGGTDGADANFVGGTAAGSGNTIAYNEFGVIVGTAPDTDSVENRVLGNSIFGSRHVPIDLAMNNASFNDPGDEDTGPNVQQNSPVLTAATVAGDSAVIEGTFDTVPNTSFRLEFFSGGDYGQEGFGEGGHFVGFANVTTDSAGHADVVVSFPASSLAGEVIQVTATSGSGNTSEASLSLAIGLSWDAPDTSSGTLNPPPRRLIAKIPDTGGKLPDGVRGPGTLLGYNLYRGDAADFQPGPDTLLRELISEQGITTFVFPRGAYFKVTAIYTTGESEPAPVAFAGGLLEVTSTKVQGSKVVVDGSGFLEGVEVFVDGWGQDVPARLKRQGTRVVQKSATAAGMKLQRYLRDRSTANLLVRNANGGLALVRIGSR